MSREPSSLPASHANRRAVVAIVPYEPLHRAMLPVRREQAHDLEPFGQALGRAAELGPAFSAVELDEQGNVAAVLACAGLAENNPNYATAWAAFAEGLRAAQWSPIVGAVRGVIEGSTYVRIDTCVRADWPVARRFAEALGFKEDFVMYARAGGESVQ